MRIRAIVPLVVSSLAIAGAAQQPSPSNESKIDHPAATLHVQAREVILPVTVRDKHGALVSSLNVSDFTLTEDGRAQKIKSFSHQANVPYKLGLLVDTSRSVSGALENERKAAAKFVDTMIPEKANPDPDEAFLLHFDREVELLQDFTTSRDKLHRELEDMGASHQSQDDRQGPETSDEDRDRPRGGRGGTQLYDAIYLASNEVMKPNDGRNALVVFSDGVDRGSKDTLNDAIDAADKANVVVYTIYFKGEQEKTGGFPTGGHHGGGWPGGGGGYPGGGNRRPGNGGERPSNVDGKKIMEQIASRTGGRFFEAKHKDNLDEIYTQIAEELRGQYLLTYTPDVVDKEGGYHKVALKASKDDMTVVTREGYFAAGEK